MAKTIEEGIKQLPSAQPETHEERTETHACDCISRQAAIETVKKHYRGIDNDLLEIIAYEMERLPSAQPDHIGEVTEMVGDAVSRQGVLRLLNAVPSEEFATKAMLISGVNALPSAQLNLSEAYSKAVFTWLRDYQIRAAELKGRYTPYEVLSWVINDWRKENG